MKGFTLEWLPSLLAAVVPILTILFGWLKVRDVARFKGIETSLETTKSELTQARNRIKELELHVHNTEILYRTKQDTWDKERNTLLQELNALRAAMARMELGTVAAIVIVNEEGDITDCNPIATEMFGWTKEELQGHSVNVLIPFRFRQAHQLAFQEAIKGVLTNTRPLRKDPILSFIMTRTGHEVPATITLTTWIEDDKRFFAAEIRRRVV